MKKHIPSLLLALLILLLPQNIVSADTGPKPEMEFTFVDENGEPSTLSIESGVLYECDLADCSDAMPLEEMGPQRFECKEFSCYSMAYGYADYFQLEISFADGTSQKSNIFAKKQFSANYLVTLQADHSLGVEEQSPSIPILPLVLTLLVELLLAYLYVTFKNKEIPNKRFLLGVLIINLITQPVFTYISVISQNMGMGIYCLFAEMVIFFVEAIFIYFFMKKEINFGKALILSFVFNFASFFIGLFLPV
ncbi:MAG: hypothetical protein HN855_09180 [Anaerolineae bacterium]|jgi:hypothetical protein|nr:hypothetical protein [Anaerolineae bacterium]MBT7070246.1 hypothetical protein [Anaerolineae bacterium]MBT7325318.1 hypothetical protein [Anaerolineae bacterium]